MLVYLVEEANQGVEHMTARVLLLPAGSAKSSIEELAARYLLLIQAAQPFGPYRLLGNGLGALVAYELANQLLGRDERVDFLGMLGCSCPHNVPQDPVHRCSSRLGAERYCPHRLPIPIFYFVSEASADSQPARSWRSFAGDSLRVIRFGDALTDEVLAGVIAKAPEQQFLQSAIEEDGYSSVVTVSRGCTHNAPVIYVPGAGGNVASGLELAQALSERTTVHGLQPRGFSGTAVPHTTVQAAAAMYLRAIRSVQPGGPYRLAGHSFGGWVAFELACRLSAQGEQVDPLVLIDTEAPTTVAHPRPRRERIDVLMRLVHALEEYCERRTNLARDELVPLSHEAQLAKISQAMKALSVLPRTSTVGDIRGLVRIFEANLNTHYHPELRFPGQVVLFQAVECSRLSEEEGGYDASAARQGWRDYVGQLECVPVRGKHMTLLKKPHVEVIAGRLFRLWKVRAPSGSDSSRPS